MSKTKHAGTKPKESIDIIPVIKYNCDIFKKIGILPNRHQMRNENFKGIISLDIMRIMDDLSSGKLNKEYNATLDASFNYTEIESDIPEVVDYSNDSGRVVTYSNASKPIIFSMLASISLQSSINVQDDNDTNGWINALFNNDSIFHHKTDVVLADITYEAVDLIRGFSELNNYKDLLDMMKDASIGEEVSNIAQLIIDVQVIKYFTGQLAIDLQVHGSGDELTCTVDEDFYTLSEDVSEFVPLTFGSLVYGFYESVALVYFALGGTIMRKGDATPVAIEDFLKVSRASDIKLRIMDFAFDHDAFKNAIYIYSSFAINATIASLPYRLSITHLTPVKDDNYPTGDADKARLSNPAAIIITPVIAQDTIETVPCILEVITYYDPELLLSFGSIIDYGQIALAGEKPNE